MESNAILEYGVASGYALFFTDIDGAIAGLKLPLKFQNCLIAVSGSFFNKTSSRLKHFDLTSHLASLGQLNSGVVPRIHSELFQQLSGEFPMKTEMGSLEMMPPFLDAAEVRTDEIIDVLVQLAKLKLHITRIKFIPLEEVVNNGEKFSSIDQELFVQERNPLSIAGSRMS
ncbi:hypothetical protein BDD12DRAFT_801062 [Trichophaea hybrida]|nr:hypothetical protein BDD12DRAFT_801062 [Trichophaea hybrida]